MNDRKELFYTPLWPFLVLSLLPYAIQMLRECWILHDTVVAWRGAEGEIISVHIPSLILLAEYFLLFQFFSFHVAVR